MVNRKYQKGYRLELRLKKELEMAGAEVFRSAGSKGTWDLIAIYDDYIQLIQVKANKGPGIKEKKRIYKSNPKHNKVSVYKLIWVTTDRMKGHYHVNDYFEEV